MLDRIGKTFRGIFAAFRKILRALGYSALGALVVLVVVFVLLLNSRTNLDVWHLAKLTEEFKANSEIKTFPEYLALEDRLFKQVDDLVYAKVPQKKEGDINRFTHGSLSDPGSWKPNWNRSFELTVDAPKARVLLLHGMSDSPYSLRAIGQRLNAAGAHVVGMRMPGHGTAPVGLVELTWQDMAAATRIGINRLAEANTDVPLYIVGYSTGSALAVLYALNAVEDETAPEIAGLAVMSPAIGVTSVAFLAVWQARLGHLLGLNKLAWNSILPEYDPYKYGSFAVNAGNVVYQLTEEIQERITALEESGKLKELPPILAFSSIVDATVSTPDLVKGLFDRLPSGGHELVLFDINRTPRVLSVLKWDLSDVVNALVTEKNRKFTLSVVANKNEASLDVTVGTKSPDKVVPTDVDLGVSWPDGIYSLAHVALPFPPNDPIYGGVADHNSLKIQIGSMILHGERGVLQISPAEMLRLRWNPFYSYIESRILNFTGLTTDN